MVTAEQSICPKPYGPPRPKNPPGKRNMWSLQHTTPLDHGDCWGGSTLPSPALCPDAPSPPGWARAVHALGRTHTFGLCTHHKGSASDLQVPDPQRRLRMLLSARWGRRRGDATGRDGPLQRVSGRASVSPPPRCERRVHTGLAALTYGPGSGLESEMTFSWKQQIDVTCS